MSASASACPDGGSPEVSIVLPCYRSGPLAARSLVRLAEFLPRHFARAEVIVVDDGGGDLQECPPLPPAVQAKLVLLARNQGKGAAVRAGMREACGRVRVFTDVDLPYGLEPIAAAATLCARAGGFDLVIGDRTLPGSRDELQVSRRRRVASLVFSLLVRGVLDLGFPDTQCGFKAVRGELARALWTASRLDGYAFDVELLFLASRWGARIGRLPVRLQSNDTSAVRLLRDSSRMLGELLRMRALAALGGYPRHCLSRARPADGVVRVPPVGAPVGRALGPL